MIVPQEVIKMVVEKYPAKRDLYKRLAAYFGYSLASEQLTAAEARIKELEEGLRNLRHGYFNDAEAVDNYIDQLLNK